MEFVTGGIVSKSVEKFGEWFQLQIPTIISFIISIVVALVAFLIGRKVVSCLQKILKKNFERMNVETGVIKFVMSLSNILLNFLLIVLVAQILGFETSSIIAILGSAVFAIGFALQGSLSNFAGGVLILVTKPFIVGDYIIVDAIEGTVVGIDVIYTRLLTVDNRRVVLPNGTLANSEIINVTTEPKRRLDLSVSIDYSENIKKVKDILEKLLQGHEMILPEEEVSIFVNSFDPSSINVGFRVWVATDDYWKLRWQLLEEVKQAFDENEIEIPFDQLDVNIRNNEPRA